MNDNLINTDNKIRKIKTVLNDGYTTFEKRMYDELELSHLIPEPKQWRPPSPSTIKYSKVSEKHRQHKRNNYKNKRRR